MRRREEVARYPPPATPLRAALLLGRAPARRQPALGSSGVAFEALEPRECHRVLNLLLRRLGRGGVRG